MRDGICTPSSGESSTRFEIVAAQLRALGISLQRLPGEYKVNVRGGGESTALIVDDLDQALELGRVITANKAAIAVAAPRTRRRSIRTTKEYRARFIRRHNKGVRRRAIRRQRG